MVTIEITRIFGTGGETILLGPPLPFPMPKKKTGEFSGLLFIPALMGIDFFLAE